MSITTASISTTELAELVRSPYAAADLAAGTHTLLVEPDGSPTGRLELAGLPFVVIGLSEGAGPAAAVMRAADLVVDPSDTLLEAILASIERRPIAATSLAVLLRSSEHLAVEHALAAESAVYSVLQSGPEFGAWLAAHEQARGSDVELPAAGDDETCVLALRAGDELRIELDRPRRHNAFSRAMRDQLCELLALAIVDESISVLHLSGRGRSFCSGGDLREFGSFSDPASAHLVRLTRSPALLVHRLAERAHVHLHGACMGAGIELAAFAHRVTAAPDASIALPELDLGLIPGAGGTVSLPRRIGRQRTAYLALSGARIDATTALAWGLVDDLA